MAGKQRLVVHAGQKHMMTEASLVLTVRITPEMGRALGKLTKGQKRARSRVVREILERGLR